MGSGASTDSSEEPSTQITGADACGSSPGPRGSITRHRSSSQAADPHQNKPVKRSTDHIDATAMTEEEKMKKKTHKLFSETSASEDELIPSAKSSLESDDAAFYKFCGEIDHVMEGHSSVVDASQRRKKSSVCSSVVPGAGTERTSSGPVQPTFHLEQLHQHDTFPTLQKQQDPQFHHQHLTHMERQHQKAQHRCDQQLPTTRPAPRIPPPLAAKSLENPLSIWKRPEDLAHQEQALRDRYQDTWVPPHRTEAESAAHSSATGLSRGASRDEGSMMRMRQNLDHQPFQEERKEMKWEEPALQEKEGFDISKFKAANKKKNGHKVDKLLPATYKGYNASLSRQGTLPSLHRGSISSTASSSGTPASDKHGSSPFDDSKDLKYNPSEEALLDFIEKEFS
ncbi:uncharacterized protein LOC119724644 [Patiria miniata]|uniref:Uncharacterized protein n=1 Tax=Patiria miniata TaxID=46514 RepID=A0A913ZKY7_PATMI|nr:uncharacterized protein LOC119724644 [Patiria miniata]XP_038051712.1 uncharacterized protein LOC119724644 [Patiria miniata]XP_038051713.1 uncharacterized protein LOC119724644 [Patiria miniata]